MLVKKKLKIKISFIVKVLAVRMTNMSKLNLLNNFCRKSHTSWRQQHIASRGNVRRMKSIAGYDFDINQTWENLNPLWRMRSRGDHIDYCNIPDISSKSIEELSSIIHDIWMENNKQHKDESWCKHKFCPYDKLPDEEKEFDRDIARILMDTF